MFSQEKTLETQIATPINHIHTNRLLLVNIEQFIKMKIKNWRYNRPADNSRIPLIMNYIKKHQRVEGIIYLAEKDDILFCYDGIHRFLAIDSLVKEYQEYHDILGSSGILDIEIILDIMPFDDEMIKERFININSSLPVPSIYTEKDQTIGKLQIIQVMWKYIEKQHFMFVMSSRKTNVPNINSSEFTDKFSVILDHTDLPEKNKTCVYDKDYWKTLFCQFNTFMKSRIIKTRYSKHDKLYSTLKMSKHQQEKCKKYDFYCFGAKDWDDYLLYFLNSDSITDNI